MRILGEQLTRLTRALGNMFIPILIKIVPYVQAFVMVLTDAAQVVANFLGFKLPTIDYSGMEGLSSGADGAAESLDNAATAAKKLKDYTLGIDELNVISKDTGAQGGATGGGGMGSDLGIKLPEYDFLGDAKSKVNEIIDNFKKGISAIEKTLKPIMPLVKGIGAALLAAFGVKKIIEFASSVKKWSFMTSLFSKITNAALGFHTVFEGTGKLLPSISAGFKTFRDSLSFATKAIVGIGSVIGVFVVFEETVRNCALGTQSLESAIAVMVVATAGFGTLLYATLGPIGLVAGALAGITGAVVGLASAQQEQLKTEMDEAFYGRKGTAISELAENYTKYSSSIRDSIQPILTAKQGLENNLQAIDGNINSIVGLASAANSTSSYISKDAGPQIEKAFENIYNSSIKNIDPTVLALGTTLKNALGDALTQMGTDVDKYVGYLYVMGDEAKANMANAKLQVTELLAEYKKTSDPELLKTIGDIAVKFSGNSDKANEFKQRLDEIKQEYNNIDFEKPDIAKEAIGKLSEQYKLLIGDIQSAKTTSGEMFDSLISWVDDPAILSIGSAMKTNMLSAFDFSAEDFTLQTGIIGDVLQGQLDKEISSRKDEIANTWWGTLKAAWSAAWSLNPFKGYETSLTAQATKGLEPIQDAINSAFGDIATAANDYGKNTSEGYRKGLVDSASVSTKAMGDFGKALIDAFHDGALRFGSPSKAMEEFGLWTTKGYATGIKDNASFATNQLETLAKDSLKAFEKANGYNGKQFIVYADYGKLIAMSISQGLVKNSDSAISALNDLGTQLKNSLADTITDMRRIANENKVTVSVVTEYTSKNVLMPNAPVKRYAMGGFPERGQMFIANEAGPELVGNIGNRTVVANNTQILDGITASMTNANQEQNGLLREQNGLLRALLNKETGVNLVVGDDVIGRANSRYESQRGVRISTGVFADAY